MAVGETKIPMARYRCSKGHEWDGAVAQHPYFKVVGEIAGKVALVVTSDPCPFCYVLSLNALPQAEEVKDAQSH